MVRLRGLGSYLAATMAALALVACGGGSPSSPSSADKLVLRGVAVGADGVNAAVAGGVNAQAASKDRIKVTIEGTSISTTVSSNGTFELENVPTGEFTLVFTINGTVVGTVHITGVPTSGEIKIVVQITVTTVVLISLEIDDSGDDQADPHDRTCMISGGKVGRKIELEGNVDSGNATTFMMDINGNRSTGLVRVDAAGASFKCNGNKGNANCKLNVTPHAKVHVSGTLTSCTTSAAQVVATEVKVQKPGGDDQADP
jgi:hypothetical protein